MRVKAANSLLEDYEDFAVYRRFQRFGSGAPEDNWLVSALHSDLDHKSDDYWGTDRDWEIADADAPSSDEFADVIQYLRSSGQASK